MLGAGLLGAAGPVNAFPAFGNVEASPLLSLEARLFGFGKNVIFGEDFKNPA